MGVNVFTIEIDQQVALKANQVLIQLGYKMDKGVSNVQQRKNNLRDYLSSDDYGDNVDEYIAHAIQSHVTESSEDISFYKQFSKWQQVVNLDAEVGATLNAIEMLRGTQDVTEEEIMELIIKLQERLRPLR